MIKIAIWRARDVVVLFNTAGTASSASAFTGTDYAGLFKTVEFKEPERGTGEQKSLGATDGLANSETWEEDPSTSEVTGDLFLTPKNGVNTDIDDLFYTATTGKFNYAQDPANPSMLIRFGDATDNVSFILQTCQLNTLGGASIDADGHAGKNGFKVTCAANLTYKEKNGVYA